MADVRGVKCPDCNCTMPATYSESKAGGVTQRQRQCSKCQRKVVTVERIIHYGDGRKRSPSG